ncbi:MAG: response regulator, partial [Clostridioides sp.]|nr:response regulator [Clostridioides sp.]
MPAILIVDDEKDIRNLIKEYATNFGYEVFEASDGLEALNICRQRDFDCIIADIMMPKMDGFSMCREIKKIKDIPVLMLSAKGEEYDKLFGFEVGVDDYVVKPFSPMELMARIKVIISRYNKSESNISKS